MHYLTLPLDNLVAWPLNAEVESHLGSISISMGADFHSFAPFLKRECPAEEGSQRGGPH